MPVFCGNVLTCCKIRFKVKTGYFFHEKKANYLSLCNQEGAALGIFTNSAYI
jgi:hypothetical protein